MTVELTADTYDEFVNSSDIPVIVDFWAPWCGPCKIIAPLIDELSIEMESEVKFAKLNIEEFPEFGIRYDIKSIPALVALKDGSTIGRVALAGGFNKSRIIENIRIAIAD
jgi:thioredoxin 1